MNEEKDEIIYRDYNPVPPKRVYKRVVIEFDWTFFWGCCWGNITMLIAIGIVKWLGWI